MGNRIGYMAQINGWLSIDKTSGSGNDSVTLTAPLYDGDGIRTTKFVVKGRYRTKEVNVSQVSEAFLKKQYLWMEFEEEGGEVQFHYGSAVDNWDEGVIEYSFNGLHWDSYQIEDSSETRHIIEMENNKTIYFRKKSGTINTDLAGLKVNYNVGGDITSVMERDVLREGVRFSKNSLTFNPEMDGNDKLIDASALIYPYDLTGYSFANQFHSCVSLINPPVLHSMILEDYCYTWMFRYCTSLKTAPELPATELKDWCYLGMFEGCTSLVNAPELPATTLVESSCYGQMFMGCTSLVNPPALPATVLQPKCYWSMFMGCTSLITTPEMVIEGYVSNPYVEGYMGYMFAGCTSLETAPITINTYRAFYDFCPNMFEGCTSLTSSPELNSESLSEGCYVNMFKGCSSLSYIKMLGKKIEGYGETLLKCLGSWVDGVASTGVFVKSKDMNSLPTGKDGIPTGWQVYNEQAPIEPDEPDEPTEP